LPRRKAALYSHWRRYCAAAISAGCATIAIRTIGRLTPKFEKIIVDVQAANPIPGRRLAWQCEWCRMPIERPGIFGSPDLRTPARRLTKA
jgi:hypothetical protein